MTKLPYSQLHSSQLSRVWVLLFFFISYPLSPTPASPSLSTSLYRNLWMRLTVICDYNSISTWTFRLKFFLVNNQPLDAIEIIICLEWKYILFLASYGFTVLFLQSALEITIWWVFILWGQEFPWLAKFELLFFFDCWFYDRLLY